MSTPDTTEAAISYPFEPSPSLHHPAPLLRGLQADRPVAPVTMPDGATAWVLTRHADVRTALTDDRFSRAAAAGPGGPAAELGALEIESLIGMDAPEHTRLRRLVARAFTPNRVAALRSRIAELVDELVDRARDRPQPVDLVEHFATPLPVRVISELLGVPEADRHRCKEWSDTMMGDWQLDPVGTRAALAGFAAMVAAKADQPGDDLITALIAARDQGDRLTDRELLMVCVGVLIGGHETTANLIGMMLLTLFRHPDQLDRLRADPAGIPAAVEELTRYIQLGGTGVMLPRITTEDVELGGVRIPAGSAVLPAFVTANRDPAVFADPDRLDTARTDNPHLGFGAGRHHCLGAHLARVELQEALRGLLALPDLRLAGPESELRFTPGSAVRSLRALPVRWEPMTPSAPSDRPGSQP
jgi:cytochrome P450